jgi:energy-coupling factor transporter ATP-binding protein EcfA2
VARKVQVPTSRTHRSDQGIAVLGATGSGKSTFLGALQIAFLNRPLYLKETDRWQIWSRDAASRAELVKMHTALTSEGKFPMTTRGIDRFDWILQGKVERTEKTGLWRTQTYNQEVELTLKLTDPTGELTGFEQMGRQLREELVGHMAGSRGILYMFDPIREFNRGDAYDKTYSLIMDLMAAVPDDDRIDGKLPHYVAICVTKLDDPRVFRTAQSLGMLVRNDHDPFGFPIVHDTDARDLLLELCKVGRKGNAQMVPQLLEEYFHRDRIAYFVTSSVGFMLNKRTRRFDEQDTENVYRLQSNDSLVRGPVNPINVVEPVLWLVHRLALS